VNIEFAVMLLFVAAGSEHLSGYTVNEQGLEFSRHGSRSRDVSRPNFGSLGLEHWSLGLEASGLGLEDLKSCSRSRDSILMAG